MFSCVTSEPCYLRVMFNVSVVFVYIYKYSVKCVVCASLAARAVFGAMGLVCWGTCVRLAVVRALMSCVPCAHGFDVACFGTLYILAVSTRFKAVRATAASRPQRKGQPPRGPLIMRVPRARPRPTVGIKRRARATLAGPR